MGDGNSGNFCSRELSSIPTAFLEAAANIFWHEATLQTEHFKWPEISKIFKNIEQCLTSGQTILHDVDDVVSCPPRRCSPGRCSRSSARAMRSSYDFQRRWHPAEPEWPEISNRWVQTETEPSELTLSLHSSNPGTNKNTKTWKKTVSWILSLVSPTYLNLWHLLQNICLAVASRFCKTVVFGSTSCLHLLQFLQAPRAQNQALDLSRRDESMAPIWTISRV